MKEDILELRKMNRLDFSLFYKWWNDNELRQWTSDTYEKMSEEEIDKILDKHIKDENFYDFIIESDEKPIGHILIQKDKKNEFELYIAIGEKDYWNRGLGTEAINLACNWFFSMFGEKSLKLEVNQDNTRAIRCYEKVGFKKIGEKTYKDKKPTFLMIKKKRKIKFFYFLTA